MDLELEGKVVLVAGGSRGIGLACARAFAREGARVAIASRNNESVAKAASTLAADGIAVHAECVDFNDVAAVNDCVARVEAALGPIAVLVNSAGAAKHHAPGSAATDRWAEGMRDKYLPTVHAIDAVLPGMAARGSGAIVNIVGIGGKVATKTHMSGGAANAALLLVSASMAKTWGPSGVRVNAINPGSIETDRLGAALKVKSEAEGKPVETLRADAQAGIPLGRYGRPEDVAAVAVFLASARASYVNGAVIAVDGGVSAIP